MSRKRKSLSQQQTHAVVRNYVITKEIIVAIEIEKNHKSMSQNRKECCNKVEELEAKNSVTTKENYVATEDEEKRTKDCRNSVFYVVTFQTYVAT